MTQVHWVSLGLGGAGALAAIVGVIMAAPPALAARKRMRMLSQAAKPMVGASGQLVTYLESFQSSLDRISRLSARGRAALEEVRRNVDALRGLGRFFTGAD
jgi:hypothetical protein